MSTFEESLYAFLLSPAATKDSMLKLADFVSAFMNDEELEFDSDLLERDITSLQSPSLPQWLPS